MHHKWNVGYIAKMNRNLRTFKYFSESTTPPFFEIFEVLDDENHPVHRNLILDFQNCSRSEFRNYINNYHIEQKLGRNQDKEKGKIGYFMAHIISNAIFNKRLEIFLENNIRPAPYNSKNLNQIPIEDNSLVFIKNFNLEERRLEYNGNVYQITPSLKAENSSYWLSNLILNSAIQLNLNFKIRLNPFIEISNAEYNPVEYRMHVHGKALNWDKLLALKNDDFGQWFDEKEYNRNGFTDYVWAPKKNNEIHFTCEELPKPHNEELVSRYFHAIFNQNTGKVKHCDGAIRIFTEKEFVSRCKHHIRDPEVRKIGKRIKIFQYDSKYNLNKELSKNLFSLLAVNFFVWNEDVLNYFN